MMALRTVIETKGLFCALYSDRGSHFFVTVKAGEKVDKNRLTQVGRAMKELGIHMIPSYSPQARGRSERSFGTWQGRLPQELRLAGITTAEGANAFLKEHYIAEFNNKFTVPAKEKGTAFRRSSRTDLNWVFTVQTERVVAKNNTVAIGDRIWQLEKSRFRHSLAGSTVTIHEHLDGSVSVRFGPHVVGRHTASDENQQQNLNRSRRAVEKPGPWKSRRASQIPSLGGPAAAMLWFIVSRLGCSPMTSRLPRIAILNKRTGGGAAGRPAQHRGERHYG